MTEHYLDRLARTICENWEQPALTDFYLNNEGIAQDTTRGNHYTYGQMYAEMMLLGDMFHALGLKQGDHIAICGSNSANWAVAYLAIAAFHGVVVTVLHSQQIEDIAHQIDFSDAVVLFTDNDLWDELQSHNLEQVKHVISLADWSILHGELIRENCERTTREELRKQLAESKLSAGIMPDDLAMICFTSGSSGVSKGVMLPVRGISNNIEATLSFFPHDKNPNYVAFLPFSHMSGIMGELIPQLVINRHIFICREICRIEDLQKTIVICKPYATIYVPKLYAGFRAKYGNSFLELLARTCKLICVGGSLLDKHLENYLVNSGIPVGIVYGLTETTAEISLSPYKRHLKCSVGKVVSGMTARISPEGEILVRGENVMLGYYKTPEATAQKIDSDGWLHTGDAGYMDEDGYLYVTGRIGQDMIVLPNGENIHPEDIERKLNALPEVKESVVVARNGRLVALVVLEQQEDDTKQQEDQQGQYQPYMADIRHKLLRTINPQLPDYSQLYDIEFLDKPLERTAKQTIKRYLYQ